MIGDNIVEEALTFRKGEGCKNKRMCSVANFAAFARKPGNKFKLESVDQVDELVTEYQEENGLECEKNNCVQKFASLSIKFQILVNEFRDEYGCHNHNNCDLKKIASFLKTETPLRLSTLELATQVIGNYCRNCERQKTHKNAFCGNCCIETKLVKKLETLLIKN
jgi:hypothetical protein